MNPNDEIRRQILLYFYDRNANTTSRMGKRGSAVKISDARRELKEQYDLKQQQVMSNLTYLIDNGWVKTVDIEKTVKVKGGTIPQTTTYYEITAKGIDKIEGGSQFEPKERYSGINITATGSNVITLGDGNVVNAQYADLHGVLEELKDAISSSGRLADSEKLELAVDVESINRLRKNSIFYFVCRSCCCSLFVDLFLREATDARRRPATGEHFQLHFPRGAGALGPSLAGDSGDGGPGAQSAVAAV